MRPPSHEIALMVADISGFGTFGGSADWSTYVGREPLSPNNVVTVYDTGGQAGSLTDVRKPSVLVRVRSTTYESGWSRANQIHDALFLLSDFATGPDLFISAAPTTDILYIGRDDKDRYLFTVNFNLTIQTGE